MSTNDSSIIELVGGIDVGNGYVKGTILNSSTGVRETVDLPSAVVSTSRTTPKVPDPDSSAVVRVVEGDFFNHLACTFTSPLVNHADLRIFGRTALSTPGSKFTQFDVVGARSKADQELSAVLVLGIFAAKALRDYVSAHGTLPDHELRVRVHAGLSLPISEYVTRRHQYASQFVGAASNSASADGALVHLVTVKNFATPVIVRLSFANVQVLPEGASAQFAITEKGEPLAQALLDDLRSRQDPDDGAQALPGVLARDLVAARNTIGVDVGEGTVNFPVFTDGAFNPEAAGTLEQGYGTALTNALDRISTSSDAAALGFNNRKQLADFLQQSPSVFLRDRYDRAAAYVTEETVYLAEEISSRFQDVLAEVGGTTEVVYVYGGGSGPIKEQLLPVLQQAAGPIPVLYLDASYSRHLNREGLFIAASSIAKQAGAQADVAPIKTRRSKTEAVA